jgi:hypothetical protein
MLNPEFSQLRYLLPLLFYGKKDNNANKIDLSVRIGKSSKKIQGIKRGIFYTHSCKKRNQSRKFQKES